MAQTLPTGEQLRFRSQYTGDHILDTYLEASEKGGRTLSDLLDDLFNSSGSFKPDVFDFRFDPATSKIQNRVGTFADSTSGWLDITPFFNIRGNFNAATSYVNFDLFTLSNNDVYIVHGLVTPSSLTFADESAVIASANTTKIVSVSEAQDWAIKMDGPVSGGEYSAKYWATSADVTTVSSNISDITAVAAIDTDISAISPIAANITSVAGISSNVTTVAGIASDVSAVATITPSDMTTVASNILDVATVADEIENSNLQSVANDIANVITVADDLNEAVSEIEVVANNITNINAVGTDIANVNAVAGISSTLTNAASDLEAFANLYLGASASPPTLDPDGSALDQGDLYFDTSTNVMKVYSTNGWVSAGAEGIGTYNRFLYTATNNQTTFTGSDDNSNTMAYELGSLEVYLNGVQLVETADYAATDGASVVLTAGVSTGDLIHVTAFRSFATSDSGNLAIASGAVPGYGLNDYLDGYLTYLGKTKSGGTWLIQRFIPSTGEMRYANLSNNSGVTTYTSAWASRASLTYNLFDVLTGV